MTPNKMPPLFSPPLPPPLPAPSAVPPLLPAKPAGRVGRLASAVGRFFWPRGKDREGLSGTLDI